MAEVWTIAEWSPGGLKRVSFELLARGRALADELGVSLVSVVLGEALSEADRARLAAYGADSIYLAQSPTLYPFVTETYAEVLIPLVAEHKPEIILAAATTLGRTLLPYLAVKLHAGLTADCTDLAIEEETGNLLQIRPAIGGNIMATIKSPNHRPQMATIRPRSTVLPTPTEGSTAAVVPVAVPAIKNPRVTVLGTESFADQQTSIEDAQVVVAGGKGMKRKEHFALLEALAKTLGGEVGATRDAVDRGWIAYPHQIGLSGKTISPRLYIAVGVSGAIQHLAGIKTAKTIVAINSDENAQILDLADFAIVGDLFEIVPELQRQLTDKEALQ